MPVVTALAFKTQDEYNTLAALHAERQAQMIDEEEQAGEDKKQAAVDERAFVVGELLKLGVWLDYSDETGRRKMFQLTRAYFASCFLCTRWLMCRGNDLAAEPAADLGAPMPGRIDEDLGRRARSDPGHRGRHHRTAPGRMGRRGRGGSQMHAWSELTNSH